MAINFGTDISYSTSEVACVICSHNGKLTDASGKTNQVVYICLKESPTGSYHCAHGGC